MARRWRSCRWPAGGAACGGVQPHVADRGRFRPVETALHFLATARRLAPDHFAWRPPAGGETRPHFDLLAGTPRLRAALDAGVPVPEIAAGWADDLSRFMDDRRAALLYD